MDDGVGNVRQRRIVYTNREKAEMVYFYGMAEGNGALAARLYRQNFGQREGRWPDGRTMANAYEALLRDGNFNGRHHDGGRPAVLFNEMEQRVLNHFQEDPESSTRSAARQLVSSKNTVNRILRRDGQHPYHFRKTQNLRE